MTTTHDVSSARVRKTTSRLADGRTLYYFDDTEPYLSGTTSRDVPDTRSLTPTEQVVSDGSTIRYDVLTGEWVALASHRMDRTFLPPADECPLCPTGRGRAPSEVPAPDYDVVVFENRFPSFSTHAAAPTALIDDEPLWPTAPARGRCEVVCFTSDHTSTFADLAPGRARTVIDAWADRTSELGRLPGVEQVFCFENRGQEIGVTLHHPHGQIYAYPFVTARTDQLLRQAVAHRQRTGGNLLRDVLDAERRRGHRVVLSGEHWTAYVPAAARWPVEVHLAPHRDVLDLPSLTDEERDELAAVYLDLLRRLDRFFVAPASAGGVVAAGTRARSATPTVHAPYIAGWHQAPVRDPRRDLGRLHLQLFSLLRSAGKLKYLAGSESGMGAWVNDTTPERIASRLREVAP